MAISVTIKDVAQRAQVSLGTVSRVLNNHHNVNEELKQRVLKAAAELGYFRVDGPKSQRRGGTTEREHNLKEIGFILTLIHHAETEESLDPFWSHILHGAESEAAKSDIKLTVRTMSKLARDPYLLLSKIHDMALDGILLVGPADHELVKVVQLTGLPLVLVDNALDDMSVDSILSDSFGGSKEAINHLLSLGHTQIAFIGGPTTASPRATNIIQAIEGRASGYRAALLEAGITPNDALFFPGLLTPESGYEACQQLLASAVPFSAIFCANDRTAIGAIRALREANLRVPDDVSVIGYDDLPIASLLTPALTTVRVHKEAMGAAAVRTLMTRAGDPHTQNYSVTLQVDLIQRDTTSSFVPFSFRASNT